MLPSPSYHDFPMLTIRARKLIKTQTRVLEELQAPLGLLDFVICALWTLRPCDPGDGEYVVH